MPQAQIGFGGASPASQTLVRGLDVLEMVATGPLALPALAHRLGLARSTTHRLATALLERRYLTLVPREGYGLGPKLLELGSCAQEQSELLRVARPIMQALAARSLDTVHLSICEAGAAVLLERISGHRRLLPRLRVGEVSPLTRSAAGCALLLDSPEAAWGAAFAQDCGSQGEAHGTIAAGSGIAFMERMREFARLGYALDPIDSPDRVRSIAAPIRGAEGAILAAIGLSAACQYLDDARLVPAARAVCDAASAISAELGCPLPSEQDPARLGTHVRNIGGARGAGATKTLEARTAGVHDPYCKATGRAGNPDLGPDCV